ncbi:hypothetical protein [Vibrio harveyi]|uniref:hypothetical protein n=1 Tax=Vibrio harveyi TaxID=669 RepID=UPI00217D7DFB|nr:hypothetical protein [Vibrio harveyi]
MKERFSTPYAELVVHGYYFNELTNHADEQMSMSAFVDMNATTQVNFNVANCRDEAICHGTSTSWH